MENINRILNKYKGTYAGLVPYGLDEDKIFRLDLSVNNPELYEFDLLSTEELSAYIDKKTGEANAEIAIGGYGEDRLIYRKSPHFGGGDDARTIHLGTDIWCKANTPLSAPAEGTIHSFQINDNFGDYGPTIILRHEIETVVFYTLYGHLSKSSLRNLQVGQTILRGEKFAEIGNETENGNWPPHVHFQVIADMQNKKGDFPGVSSQRQKAYFLQLCPDPAPLLNLTR
jgi:peptidoglycan LD-endopeptidase LytH